MRTKLGLAVGSLAVSAVLVFGAVQPAGASPSETTAPTTIETTTTTTLPPVIEGPARIGDGSTTDGDVGETPPPQRGTSVVINPPPEPPATTTTTIAPTDYGLPANSGSGFRVVYSKSLQRVWVVNSNNQVLKEHLVSGRQRSCDPTPGSYQVYSRSRNTFAIQNPSLIWGFMIRFAKGCNGGNIGFHEIPVNKNTGRPVQSLSQLGTPLSGGCVRQSQSDAVWMWNNIGVGTSVVVLP